MTEHKWRFMKDEYEGRDEPGVCLVYECRVCVTQTRSYSSWPFDIDRAKNKAPKYCEETR